MRPGLRGSRTAIAALAMAGAGLLTPGAAEARGQVTMIVTGAGTGPQDRATMPLENGGDPAVKVALAQIQVAEGAMTARLTTRVGVLSFEADAPAGVGDRPRVRSAAFFGQGGARYALGATGAELTIEGYSPGRAIAFVFSAAMDGADGGPGARVTVQTSAPVSGP